MSENTSDPWAEVTDEVSSRDASASGDADKGEGGESGSSGATESPGASGGASPGASGDAAGAGAAGAAGTDEHSRSTPSTAASEESEGGRAYDSVREVLDAVAEGAINPDEANRLLSELRGEEEATGQRIAAGSEPAAATVDRLRVRAIGRRVRLIGEPFVSTVAVDGPHVVRQEGTTLVVASEGEFGASLDGATLTPPRSFRDVQQKFMEIGRELAIRVNPDLIVETEITAGSLNAERLPKLENVRATAGSVRVRDVEGPLDLLVQAGSAQVEGRLHRGHSRFRTESGSLQLRLLKGSSVRIRQDTQLGRVQWDAGDTEEYVVGAGGAHLDLEVVMAQATVKEAK